MAHLTPSNISKTFLREAPYSHNPPPKGHIPHSTRTKRIVASPRPHPDRVIDDRLLWYFGSVMTLDELIDIIIFFYVYVFPHAKSSHCQISLTCTFKSHEELVRTTGTFLPIVKLRAEMQA